MRLSKAQHAVMMRAHELARDGVGIEAGSDRLVPGTALAPTRTLASLEKRGLLRRLGRLLTYRLTDAGWDYAETQSSEEPWRFDYTAVVWVEWNGRRGYYMLWVERKGSVGGLGHELRVSPDASRAEVEAAARAEARSQGFDSVILTRVESRPEPEPTPAPSPEPAPPQSPLARRFAILSRLAS